MTEPTDKEQYLNIADQCAATATSDLAASILVDGGNGTLRQLLNDAADAIRAGWTTNAQAAPAAVAGPSDTFRGDTTCLVQSIIALLELDAEGALVPHGIGGHARALLYAAASRLAAPTAQTVPVRGAPADLPPLPDPDLRDVGTTPGGIKEFLRGYATEYAKAALASSAPADSVPEDAARLTYEQAHAIRQGHEISASDGYFEARPQIDSNDRRKVFQAGFERGWDAARKQGETNEH